VIRVCITVKTATIRDLRNNFARVSAWIQQGEAVEITKGGKPFARLVAAPRGKLSKSKKPDILRRLKRTWGNRVFSAAEVASMRAAEIAD
jgi:antitoxin (DNA-binding transcriptional repressor) of toxin-antitoxin stability system